MEAISKKQFLTKHRQRQILLVLALLALAIQTLKDSLRNGDFIGYLNAGNLVLDGQNIYSDYLNTWPPFFSIASVPLALLDGFSPFLVRFVWLLGSWVCLFFCFRMVYQMFFERKLLLPFQKVAHPQSLSFAHPMVLVPFFLILRFLLDNSSHLQINVYMMAMALASVYFYHQQKWKIAAFLLGLSIALKVFTVFVLLYFLYKRAYRLGVLAIFFVFLFGFGTIVIFGWDDFISYHQMWFANQLTPLPTPNHMNQSLMAIFVRLFTTTPTGINFSIYITALSSGTIKIVYYTAVLIAAIVPLYLFRNRLEIQKPKANQIIQWAILFAAVPMLSPVAWKPYFVFLWMPIVVAYYFLFYKKNEFQHTFAKPAKILFYASMLLLIGCSELFVGNYFSDVLEVLGAVTWGTILLLIALLLVYLGINNQEREITLKID